MKLKELLSKDRQEIIDFFKASRFEIYSKHPFRTLLECRIMDTRSNILKKGQNMIMATIDEVDRNTAMYAFWFAMDEDRTFLMNKTEAGYIKILYVRYEGETLKMIATIDEDKELYYMYSGY